MFGTDSKINEALFCHQKQDGAERPPVPPAQCLQSGCRRSTLQQYSGQVRHALFTFLSPTALPSPPPRVAGPHARWCCRLCCPVITAAEKPLGPQRHAVADPLTSGGLQTATSNTPQTSPGSPRLQPQPDRLLQAFIRSARQ